MTARRIRRRPPAPKPTSWDSCCRRSTERNGFQTCFRHKHFGDTIRGNLAVLEEVAYGPTPIAGSCAAIFGSPTRHRIVFEYADLKQAGYFFTWTLRFGAPVSFESLLTRISIYAMGNKEYSFALVHDGTSSETRRPRLVKIQQEVTDAQGKSTARTLRAFAYGDRSGQFNEQAVARSRSARQLPVVADRRREPPDPAREPLRDRECISNRTGSGHRRRAAVPRHDRTVVVHRSER